MGLILLNDVTDIIVIIMNININNTSELINGIIIIQMNLSFGTPLSKGHFHSGDTKFGPDKYSHNLFIDYPCWNDTSI